MKLDKLIEYSLYILIFSLPFSKSIIEICAIVAITSWFLKKLLSVREGIKLPQTPLNLPLLIFVLISFLSIFWSTHTVISIRAFFRKLSEYILLYFIVVEIVNEKRIVRNMIKALALALFIMCANGIYQHITTYDFVRNYQLHSMQQVTSAFKFPNGFSAWLIVVTLPFVSLALFFKGDLKLRRASSVLAILAAYCLFLTYTRGAIISFVLTLCLLFLLKGGKLYYAVVAVLILVILAIAFLLPEGVGGYKGIKYYLGLSELFSGITSQHRLRIWKTAWRMFTDSPFLGQGLNTFMANYERFRIPEEYGIWYAHNCYLQIAAEIGIFGLLSFLWMIVRMVVISIKSLRLIKDEFLKYTFLGLFCGIVAYLLQSAVETNLYSLQLAVLFYFSLGFLMAIRNIALKGG